MSLFEHSNFYYRPRPRQYLYPATDEPVPETLPPVRVNMDTSIPYPTFPHPPPTRVRCPRSLPELTTSAVSGRNFGAAGGETPAIPTPTTAQGNGAGGTPVEGIVNISSFLSTGSKVLRCRTGNHRQLSHTTAASCLLTELRDVRLISSSTILSRRSQLTGVVSQVSSPLPISVWAVKSGYALGNGRGELPLFCVYRTHEDVSVISPFDQLCICEEAITFPNFTARRVKTSAQPQPPTETLVAYFFH